MHFFFYFCWCVLYIVCVLLVIENKLFLYKCLMMYELVQEKTASSTPAKIVVCIFSTTMGRLYTDTYCVLGPMLKTGTC